jgi:hypothetical protein
MDERHPPAAAEAELSPFVRWALRFSPVTGVTAYAVWQWLDGTALSGRPFLAAGAGILGGAIVGMASDRLIISMRSRFRRSTNEPRSSK